MDLDPQFNCSQYLVGARRIETIISNGLPTVQSLTTCQGPRVDSGSAISFSSCSTKPLSLNPPKEGVGLAS